MKASYLFLAVLLGAPTLATNAQTPPGSAAVPIKELTPPPPNPADGKHLIQSDRPRTSDIPFSDPRQEKEWVFKDRDRNSDGRLSKDEFPLQMRPGFSRADADTDGSVTLEEYLSYLGLGLGPARRDVGAPAPPGILAFQNLAYAGTENPRQQLNLYLPKQPKTDSPLPLVVFVQGGGWQRGTRGREPATSCVSSSPGTTPPPASVTVFPMRLSGPRRFMTAKRRFAG